MLAEDADKVIKDWLKKNAEQVDATTWKCKKCGDVIWALGERVSIHDCFSLFKSHSGSGEVREIHIPYCRQCDKEPTIKIGCLDY